MEIGEKYKIDFGSNKNTEKLIEIKGVILKILDE